MGENGRMLLMNRPSEAEQISTLWRLYLTAERDKEELKAKLDFHVSALLVYK